MVHSPSLRLCNKREQSNEVGALNWCRGADQSPFALRPGLGKALDELSALLVNGTPARTCGKWPILRKAASLLSGNLTRTPGPDLLVGPFQGDFLSVSSYQCTFG